MMLSTIILNWNRVELLKQCIDSYLATVGGDFELMIVDNASIDGSRDYLRWLEATQPQAKVFCLPENIGGEAFNSVVPQTRGDLIHLSENDQIFLPGWREYVQEAFAAHPLLGQLSLFSDTPTDDEAWEPKTTYLRFSRGNIVYEAHNVGTSSIIRAELLRGQGITIGNIENAHVKLPDDARLSHDIRAAGFACAFSDRYHVRNLGHEVAEFERDPAYYTENYASKSPVGVAGWQARIEEHRSRPHIVRESVAFPEGLPIPEKTLEPVNGRPARLWSMFDGNTAETEVLDLMLVLTRLVKPIHVLETGTWLGLSSCAIARGLVANGFGDLTTLEINSEVHQVATENIARYGYTKVVDARLASSMEFVPDRTYDMAVFDSETNLRLNEFRRFRPWLKDGALVIFHDTAPHHHWVLAGIVELLKEGALHGVNFPTPRGVFVGRVNYTTGT
jgi:predicted O-methyltransferase YrrM